MGLSRCIDRRQPTQPLTPKVLDLLGSENAHALALRWALEFNLCCGLAPSSGRSSTGIAPALPTRPPHPGWDNRPTMSEAGYDAAAPCPAPRAPSSRAPETEDPPTGPRVGDRSHALVPGTRSY